MRLLKIHIENYINIYNGMGKHSLTIDFSKCRHKLLVIKGMNGSGKSSLFKAMNPFMDDSSVFIPDKEVKKNISYLLNDGTILDIKYSAFKSSSNRNKPSRCSIVRIYPDGTTFELNENGNILSGKQIIYDLLDLDDNYITLSNISATNKGLGSLTPHERKKYVGNILSALSDYNDMHKLFTSKLSVLKSLIKSISVKLSQIGSIEVVKTNIANNTNTLNALESERDILKTKEVTYLTKLDQYTKNGNPIEIMNRLVAKRNILEANLSNLPIEDIQACSEEKFYELSNAMTKYRTKEELLDSQLKDLVRKELDITNKLNESKIKLESLYDKTIFDNIVSRIETLKNNLKFYKTCFQKIGFTEYDNITENDYIMVIEAIDSFNKSIHTLHENYSISIIEEAIKWLDNKFPQSMFIEVKSKLEEDLNYVKQQILEDDILVEKSRSFSKIPNVCSCPNICPFVKDIFNAQKSKLSDEDKGKLLEKRDKIISSINLAMEEFDRHQSISSCISEIKSILASILSVRNVLVKFKELNKPELKEDLVTSLKHNYPISIDVDKYREHSNYITAIQSTTIDIENLEIQKNNMIDKNKEAISLKSVIEKYNVDLLEITETKSTLIGQINEVKREIELISNEYEYNKTLKDKKEQYIQFSEELENIKKEIQSMNIEEYKTLYSKVSEIGNRLNELNHNSIPLVRNELETNKYQIVLYDQYKKDYEEYESKYNMILSLKNYSGVNGIQTIYMSIFMNSILNEANSLLSNLFKGRFKLQPFIINENEFVLPCIDDKGNIRPDIGLMSDSQLSEISMILSFVLLHKASKRYNIIKLDEVDDNLDNENRLQFAILLDKIMEMLEFDQCVLISHNDEIDLSNADLIITRVEDVSYHNYLKSSGANIIADFS